MQTGSIRFTKEPLRKVEPWVLLRPPWGIHTLKCEKPCFVHSGDLYSLMIILIIVTVMTILISML